VLVRGFEPLTSCMPCSFGLLPHPRSEPGAQPDHPVRVKHSSIVDVGSDTPQMLAVYLGMLDVDFEVRHPPELIEQLQALSDRYRRAITTTGSGT
jgi:hypothetical protein